MHICSSLCVMTTRCKRVYMRSQIPKYYIEIFIIRGFAVICSCFNLRSQRVRLVPFTKTRWTKVMAGHFHCIPDRSTEVFVQQDPLHTTYNCPTSIKIYTSVHTVPNPWICNATPCLSLINYRCYQRCMPPSLEEVGWQCLLSGAQVDQDWPCVKPRPPWLLSLCPIITVANLSLQ